MRSLQSLLCRGHGKPRRLLQSLLCRRHGELLIGKLRTFIAGVPLLCSLLVASFHSLFLCRLLVASFLFLFLFSLLLASFLFPFPFRLLVASFLFLFLFSLLLASFLFLFLFSLLLASFRFLFLTVEDPDEKALLPKVWARQRKLAPRPTSMIAHGYEMYVPG